MKSLLKICVLTAFVGFGAIGCADDPDKEEPACQMVDGELVDNCPGTTSCWMPAEGTADYECVEQCTPTSCEAGQICAGGLFEPATCKDIPECDIEATAEECTGGCYYDSSAPRVQVEGETCTLIEDDFGACVAPNFEECLNGCPYPVLYHELPDGSGVLVTTETGSIGGSEPIDSCYELAPL